MARKFLYLIAILVVLIIGALAALRIWSSELTELAFVPRSQFEKQEPLQANAYEDPAMWFARPGLGGENPARWTPLPKTAQANAAGLTLAPKASAEPAPAGPSPVPEERAEPPAPPFAVFFVHPTSYFNRAHWNAPLDDPESQERAQLFLRGMASPFNQAAEIWAPRYRQATVGAFLTDKPEADLAVEAAYRDVEQAFDYFVSSVDARTPILLAGHSQGASHILRLLHEKVAGKPLQSRIAAAYVIGWPISVEHDLPALGLPDCRAADQGGCIVSWSSFAEPADPRQLMERYGESPGLDGQPRGASLILCTNPLTGATGGAAEASANLGTLVPDSDLRNGVLVSSAVPARCDERGLLLIGDPPELGPYVLPGNNYHVYDIPLFWANLKQDAMRRVHSWRQAR